jgi:hypothetical protein
VSVFILIAVLSERKQSLKAASELCDQCYIATNSWHFCLLSAAMAAPFSCQCHVTSIIALDFVGTAVHTHRGGEAAAAQSLYYSSVSIVTQTVMFVIALLSQAADDQCNRHISMTSVTASAIVGMSVDLDRGKRVFHFSHICDQCYIVSNCRHFLSLREVAATQSNCHISVTSECYIVSNCRHCWSLREVTAAQCNCHISVTILLKYICQRLSIKSGIIFGYFGQYLRLPVETIPHPVYIESLFNSRPLVVINLEPQWVCFALQSPPIMKRLFSWSNSVLH